MFFLNTEPEHDLFGRAYKLHLPGEAPPPQGLDPERFLWEDQAERFLRELTATAEFWRSLIADRGNMNPNDEQLRDVVENCSILLGKLSGFQQTDDTPEGRMVSQLKWLKERAEDKTLTLPVDPRYLATLRRVYTEGDLCRHASAPDKAPFEIEIYMKRLIKLTRDNLFLIKPEYYEFATQKIQELIRLFENPGRALSAYEKNSIHELKEIKTKLADGSIEPPLMTWKNYPNFRKVYRISKSTIDDLPDGKLLCKTVASLIFEGVRPSGWTTPKAAARETGLC